MKRQTHCVTCGWILSPKDKRRRYCTYDCFLIGNRKWHRDRKRRLRATAPEIHRVAVKKWKQSERGKAKTKEYLPRARLLSKAREEAKETGTAVIDVLIAWKADIGRVRRKGEAAWQ